MNKRIFHNTRLKRLLLAVLILMLSLQIKAQGQSLDSAWLANVDVLRAEIIDGDTILMWDLAEVVIYPEPQFSNKRDYRKYKRLIRNVKKVYPYAKLAGEKLEEVNEKMADLETEKERKNYIKEVEAELMDEHEEDLKKLTITQGKILIKLIDRETGDTSYELVEELRGKFSAIFWQALARLFGSNLKTEYDPTGEDKLIEHIVLMIESGQL
jgi:hypothetical protein